MFEKTIRDLQILERTEMEIHANGEYPESIAVRKRKTKRIAVQKVAKWQNDGTRHIPASKFVERAAKRKSHWQPTIYKAVKEYLFKHGNLRQVLEYAGLKVSYDINVMCDRIDTGRLTDSMRPRITFR